MEKNTAETAPLHFYVSLVVPHGPTRMKPSLCCPQGVSLGPCQVLGRSAKRFEREKQTHRQKNKQTQAAYHN